MNIAELIAQEWDIWTDEGLANHQKLDEALHFVLVAPDEHVIRELKSRPAVLEKFRQVLAQIDEKAT